MSTPLGAWPALCREIAAASVAAALFLSAGCDRLSIRGPAVHDTAIVDHLSLVEANVEHMPDTEWETIRIHWWEEVAIPPGVLPPGRVPRQSWDTGAHGYRAVPCATTQNGEESFEVWLFSEDWTRIAGILIPPPPQGYRQDGAYVSWAPTAPELAVVVGLQREADPYARGVQIFRLVAETPRPEQVLHIPEAHEVVTAWAGTRLVIVYNSAGKNLFRTLDLQTGETVVLYERPRVNPLLEVLPSPDGRFLAFSTGLRSSPLWLLDLRSGDCHQLTYERREPYSHRPIKWDGPNLLRFLRRSPGPGDDICVTHIRPPSAEAPQRPDHDNPNTIRDR